MQLLQQGKGMQAAYDSQPISVHRQRATLYLRYNAVNTAYDAYL
jgi:hypothetical protein